jgi:hypothetical protein
MSRGGFSLTRKLSGLNGDNQTIHQHRQQQQQQQRGQQSGQTVDLLFVSLVLKMRGNDFCLLELQKKFVSFLVQKV